jgi:hypothetical protein
LFTPTTEYLEYHFLRDILRQVPYGCRLAAIDQAEKRVWIIPSHLLPGSPAGFDVRVQNAADMKLAMAPGTCLLYVHSSLCTSREGRELCNALESAAQLEPISSKTFPARASYRGLPYDSDQVEVTLFRVTGVSIGTAAEPQVTISTLSGKLTPLTANAAYDDLRTSNRPDGCRVMRFDTIADGALTLALRDSSGASYSVSLLPENGGEIWVIKASAATQRTCGATLSAIQRSMSSVIGSAHLSP